MAFHCYQVFQVEHILLLILKSKLKMLYNQPCPQGTSDNQEGEDMKANSDYVSRIKSHSNHSPPVLLEQVPQTFFES